MPTAAGKDRQIICYEWHALHSLTQTVHGTCKWANRTGAVANTRLLFLYNHVDPLEDTANLPLPPRATSMSLASLHRRQQANGTCRWLKIETLPSAITNRANDNHPIPVQSGSPAQNVIYVGGWSLKRSVGVIKPALHIQACISTRRDSGSIFPLYTSLAV